MSTSANRPRAGRIVVAAWLAAVVAAQLAAGGTAARAGPIEGTPPYPPSGYITAMALDWGTMTRLAIGSDNWATTWAADGNVYTSWGDGGGFGEDSVRRGYVSFGIARITGSSARTVAGTNLIGGLAPTVGRCFPVIGAALRETKPSSPASIRPCYRLGIRGKSYGKLALYDQLYLFISPGSTVNNLDEARLYKGAIGSNSWRQASWAFTRNDPYPLLAPTFVQAGRNYADIADYFYAYSTRYAPNGSSVRAISVQKGPNGGEIALLRVRRGADLMNRANWEFFAGLDAAGAPRWTADQAQTRAVIVDRSGVGFTSAAIYVRALGRFLLLTQHGRDHANLMTVLEAPNPWGPWRTVAYTTLRHPQGLLDIGAFYFGILANSVSADGTRFTLVTNGRDNTDGLVMIDGRFTVNRSAR